MKIGYCRNCTMDRDSLDMRSHRQRIIIRIAVDITIWISVSLVAFYLFFFEKPYERGFFCDDKSLSYPPVPETITTPVLLAVGLTAALLLIISIELFNCLDNCCRQKYQRSSGVVFCVKTYIVFMIGFLLQELFVDTIKNKTGVLRPTFLAVCKPQYNSTLCPGYISEYTCAGNDEKEIRRSRQSFPSGHSSFAMYIAVYFCLYTEQRLQIKFSRLMKIFLQTGLVLAAMMCGFGRIRENKHHFSDVTAGFILGSCVAIFVHCMLWRKYVKEESDRKQQKIPEKKTCECYCLSDQPSDTDTSPSLSQNGYFQNIESGRNLSSSKLIAITDNNNRTFSEQSEI